MSVPVIKIENLQKNYRIGEIGTGTLSQDLNRYWAKIRGKADPFEKVGLNDRTQKAQKGEIVSALRNVSLTVDRGEVLGIIGKNGAGKSTLLKILSRVTAPTSGKIRIRGRMASLLEIGTGFHTEMTGRENIYMNGTIMGMRKWEITKKLDEIVDFAGVAKYLDTPTKRYSSGMTVRLGFAVAAFLEPEILVVDEVLAVGDAEFQKKAIGKMQDVSKEGGRTVLFVSHNMMSIRKLCSHAILLEKGLVKNEGLVDTVIDDYLKTESLQFDNGRTLIEWKEELAPGNNQVKLVAIQLQDSNGNAKDTFQSSEEILINMQLKINSRISGTRIVVHILTEEEDIVFSTTDQLDESPSFEEGKYEIVCRIPGNLLNQRKYKVRINMGIPGVYSIIDPRIFFIFQVVLTSSAGIGLNRDGRWPGVIAPRIDWKREQKPG